MSISRYSLGNVKDFLILRRDYGDGVREWAAMMCDRYTLGKVEDN